MLIISRLNFRRRKLKKHVQYLKFRSSVSKRPAKFARVKYKKLVYKYKKFRNARRKRRLIKRLRYFYYRRIYKFLSSRLNLQKTYLDKSFSAHKLKYIVLSDSFPPRNYILCRSSKASRFYFSNFFKTSSLSDYTQWKKKFFKRYRIFLFRKKQSKKRRYFKRFKKQLKYYLRRSVHKRTPTFFKRKKLRKKKIRFNKYSLVKNYSSFIISKRFVRSIRHGFLKTLKHVKGIKNILAVRIIKTYNNFFVALQTSLGQNILSYSTGRVDLRRNRRLTKQALEIASRNFSIILKRRKFSRLNFTIIGRATYHSRIFLRALKQQGVKIRAIKFVLRRSHNGLRIRASRRV